MFDTVKYHAFKATNFSPVQIKMYMEENFNIQMRKTEVTIPR